MLTLKGLLSWLLALTRSDYGVIGAGWMSVRQAAYVVRKGFWLVGYLGFVPRWMRSLCQKACTIWGNHFG
jgi:hypothetical protein